MLLSLFFFFFVVVQVLSFLLTIFCCCMSVGFLQSDELNHYFDVTKTAWEVLFSNSKNCRSFFSSKSLLFSLLLLSTESVWSDLDSKRLVQSGRIMAIQTADLSRRSERDPKINSGQLEYGSVSVSDFLLFSESNVHQDSQHMMCTDRWSMKWRLGFKHRFEISKLREAFRRVVLQPLYPRLVLLRMNQ